MRRKEDVADQRAGIDAANLLSLPFALSHRQRLLLANFHEPQHMLSWSLTRPGFQIARQVAWIEIRDADLPAGQDAEQIIASRIAKAKLADAVSLITSRDINRHHMSQVAVGEDDVATCVTTVGLSNGERVGQRFAIARTSVGTINTMVHISKPLSEAALIEAITIAAEARTAAILDAGVRRCGVAITGTGTDCIVVAAPRGGSVRFAGMHTPVGEAIGAAVYKAMGDGIATWLQDMEAIHLAAGVEG